MKLEQKLIQIRSELPSSQEWDNMGALAKSIKLMGLLYPLVIYVIFEKAYNIYYPGKEKDPRFDISSSEIDDVFNLAIRLSRNWIFS
jgi:hypothetical protein